MSLPGVYAEVKRPSKVKLPWTDEDGNQWEKTFKGYQGRIIQHEMDHLRGVQFYEHLSPEELKKIQPAIDDLRSGEITTACKYKTLPERKEVGI